MTAPLLNPVDPMIEPQPLVSVIMPTYNRSELMAQSAQMVLAQTVHNLELIISDDQSTDDTPYVAQALAQSDARVLYHRPAVKGGINTVINEGIGLSRGKYIQICHDHDIYMPMLSEKMADVMERHSSVVFVHPGRQGCDHEGNPLPHAYFVMNYPEVTDGRAWRRLMLRRLASPVTALSMIRRSGLEQVRLFDPEFGACSDIDMWMRLCAVGDVGYVNELLLFVRGREPNHPYAGFNWEIGDQVIRIHRKHLKITFHGIEYCARKLAREWEIDRSLTFDYLNSIRHRNWHDHDKGRAYLRQRGVFFSKLVAYLL